MKNIKANFIFILYLIVPAFIFAQNDSLRSTIDAIATLAQGNVSVSIRHIENGDMFSFNGQNHCVMQSVFKLPIALAVLDKTEQQKFTLKNKICIKKREIIKDTWSPMRDKFPNENIKISIAELIQYMISQSDNIACDVLLNKIGGTKEVEKLLRKFTIFDIEMPNNEAEMHKSWEIQYQNWCTPDEMTKLITLFYTDKILSKENTAFLKTTLEETTTGPNKIKGLLPKGTIVGHKTGTSGKNEAGMTAAVNDVGIITLPDGNHIAIAIFLNDIYADERIQNFVIAGIAKAAYDYYTHAR